MPVVAKRRAAVRRPRKERVLIEFPEGLLKRADEAARKLEKNRSELIRSAVEQMLAELEKKQFDLELAKAYAANAGLSLDMLRSLQTWIARACNGSEALQRDGC